MVKTLVLWGGAKTVTPVRCTAAYVVWPRTRRQSLARADIGVPLTVPSQNHTVCKNHECRPSHAGTRRLCARLLIENARGPTIGGRSQGRGQPPP